MRLFPYPPEVASLMSDGHSSGSNGHMTASINTAMSYASVVSNLTPESQTDAPHQRQGPSKTALNQGHAKKAWNTPPPTMITASDTDAGSLSELQSSKSEVEALKSQMSKMETEKEEQIQEIE